jgi:hypothetical protein
MTEENVTPEEVEVAVEVEDVEEAAVIEDAEEAAVVEDAEIEVEAEEAGDLHSGTEIRPPPAQPGDYSGLLQHR